LQTRETRLFGKKAQAALSSKAKSPGQTTKHKEEERSNYEGRTPRRSLSASMKKKGSRTKEVKKKAAKKKNEDSANKTKKRKKKAAFAEQDKAGKIGYTDKVDACIRCIVGFAIRVENGNKTKGEFNKKLAEGLTFLKRYLDKAACILPNRLDQRLGPIKGKADIPKYQVIIKIYVGIPNPMAFLNVSQDGGKVNKGSAILGFSLDPKECLDNVCRGLKEDGQLINIQ
jgi:hypothetical protein